MPERQRRLAVVTALLAVAALAGCTSASPVTATRSTARPSGTRPAGRRRAPRAARSSGQAAAPEAPEAPSAPSGRLLTRSIAGRTSGFRARPALIWLPPVLSRRPHLRLPVLELLPGSPGAPLDWTAKGEAEQSLDAFADQHGGRAPIVVMPDINGTERGDTECITTPGGADVERYLAVDVPRWIRAHLRTATDRRWAVAGLSEGGTCSLMLALRHPAEYGVFGDFSGLARPTLGDRDDEARTVRVLFHGSPASYDRHDPLWLLRHRRYATLAGWIEYGAADLRVRQASTLVAAAARSAGAAVREASVAGRHSWPVWRAALRSMLPWMWERLA